MEQENSKKVEENTVHCPTCNSTNVNRISTTAKATTQYFLVYLERKGIKHSIVTIVSMSGRGDDVMESENKLQELSTGAKITLATIDALINSAKAKASMVDIAELQKNSVAEVIAANLYKMVIDYQSKLSETDDVAMSVVSFNSTTLIVDSIGYIGYNLIRFVGKDNSGKPLELVQYVSQLNFLLMVVPKPEPEAPKRKIGFVGQVEE